MLEITGEKQRCERLTVAQLPDANKPRHILVEHLEPTTIFLRLARLTETTGAVQDLEKGLEVD